MEETKLFVGGITPEMKEDTLTSYFSKYGEVSGAVIVKDKITGNSRGYAFIFFSEPSILDAVLGEKHMINGRKVDVERPLSSQQKQDGVEENHENRKIFVGGLPTWLTEIDFAKYFMDYGNIASAIIKYDRLTARSRGFGFVTYDSQEAANRVLEKTYHEIHGKIVEVKKAIPKEACPKSCKYSIFPPPAFGAYSPFPGYGALDFGYGDLAGNRAFCGSFTGFGGYGILNAGYSGSAALPFGNQVAPNTGVLNSYAGLEKIQWGSFAESSAGAIPHFCPSYGGIVPWTSIGTTSITPSAVVVGNQRAGNVGGNSTGMPTTTLNAVEAAGNHGAGNHGAGNHGAGNHGAGNPGAGTIGRRSQI